MITYKVIRTRTGRHYVKVLDGDKQIYVTRGAFTSAEPALTEARNFVKGTPEESEPETEPAARFSFFKKLLPSRR